MGLLWYAYFYFWSYAGKLRNYRTLIENIGLYPKSLSTFWLAQSSTTWFVIFWHLVSLGLPFLHQHITHYFLFRQKQLPDIWPHSWIFFCSNGLNVRECRSLRNPATSTLRCLYMHILSCYHWRMFSADMSKKAIKSRTVVGWLYDLLIFGKRNRAV